MSIVKLSFFPYAIWSQEHPHVDRVNLRGEVFFPNLEFDHAVVDFGCILNDTEVTRYVRMTNNSPMDVQYRWSFLIGDKPYAVFQKYVYQRLEIFLVAC